MEVRFKDLDDHIVDVVLTEVKHPVSQGEGLLLDPMHIELFR